MIPYLEQPSVRLGPITIAAFGVIVATSVLVGLSLGRRRFERLGLDSRLGEGLAGWVIVGGFIGAHLFSVLLYFPREVAANPLILLQFWKDISSFGGILGGALALWLFLRRRAADLRAAARWAYVDVVAFVFPISLMIGRLACAVAHDHPGTITRAPLAVSLARPEARAYLTQVYADAGRLAELPPPEALARLGFHDLGWYEFLFLAVVVVPVTVWLARRPRRPGTFVASFIALYMPVRFLLDFLRVSDARYAGLTPAQWVAAAALAALGIATVRTLGSTHRDAPTERLSGAHEAADGSSPDPRPDGTTPRGPSPFTPPSSRDG